MKIYLRLLSYAKPIEKFAIPYFFFSVLSVVFGLLNFTLLIPLFDILFKDTAQESRHIIEQKPIFHFTAKFFQDYFYYTFFAIIKEYGKMGALKFICGTILCSVFLSNLFKYLSQRIMENLRVHTLLRLRKAVFEKIISMHLGYFSNERKGVLISKLTGDVQVIQNSITGTLLVFFKEPITLLGYFIVLFIMSPQMTFFTILLIPISGFVISAIVKRLKQSSFKAQNLFGVMVSNIEEALSGIRVIHAFNAKKYIQDKFHNENLHYTKIIRSMARRQELAAPASEFLGITAVSILLLYGGSLVFSGNFSASTFIAYIIIYSQVLKPAKDISSSFSAIQHGIASGERVLHIIDTKNEIEEKKDALPIHSFNKEIEFKNVSFAYEKNIVLNNISFKIPAGKTIALVGPSGGGKSTIADLIPRFYDPKEGEILMDGIPLKDLKLDDLRNLMGIVTQESVLFNDTIFNNIAFGKPHATEEEVIQAAKVANAHDFIMRTPQGYQTGIGDRGVKLSGGQKQRLSIARAVLKNPPILLLDEATSALDTESEKLVQDALLKLMKNRTSLVIAHRLSTIQSADEIIIVHEGKIAERGSHNDLMNIQNGIYNKLKNMQVL